MNEAGDVVNNLPAILLLSMWWALLSALDLLSRPREPGQAGDAAKPDTVAAGTTAPDPRLGELLKLDPGFDADAFLDCARRAFEEIVKLYAQGDFAGLRPLLSAAVLEVFSDARAGYADRGETLVLTFVGIDSAAIVSTDVTAEAAEISVLFRAEIVSAVFSASGDVVSGDPVAVIVTDELWIFSRPPGDGEAPWVVVATGQG